jgi:hypothetical protein
MINMPVISYSYRHLPLDSMGRNYVCSSRKYVTFLSNQNAGNSLGEGKKKKKICMAVLRICNLWSVALKG